MSTVRPTCVAATLASLIGIGLAAQPPVRRAATIEAVRTYVGFFHSQAVTLQGRVVIRGTELALSTETASLRMVGRERPGEGPAEIRGVVYDVGRMNSDDPRLVTLGLREMIQQAYGERWPRPGEEIVLDVTSSGPLPAARNSNAPPIRHVALDPTKYDGTAISVVGQFRGRNLFADVPDAPTSGRDDFVLRSGDAALWVTGVRPRGKGFNFDPSRRVDTGRWVRVSGTVRQARGLVWIEGVSIELAEAPSEDFTEVAGPAPPPPPLDVLFTSPAPGEIDVQLDTVIRLQFSRDVDVASLKDRIRISYSAAESVERGEPQPPAVAFTLNWTAVNRGLEIRPTQPLERFRQVQVDLLDGVRGPDGAVLRPFTLSFSTGGS